MGKIYFVGTNPIFNYYEEIREIDYHPKIPLDVDIPGSGGCWFASKSKQNVEDFIEKQKKAGREWASHFLKFL